MDRSELWELEKILEPTEEDIDQMGKYFSYFKFQDRYDIRYDYYVKPEHSLPPTHDECLLIDTNIFLTNRSIYKDTRAVFLQINHAVIIPCVEIRN